MPSSNFFRKYGGGQSSFQNGSSQATPEQLNIAQGIFGRARQIAKALKSPQEMVMAAFPNIPESIRNDPDQIMTWLEQQGVPREVVNISKKAGQQLKL